MKKVVVVILGVLLVGGIVLAAQFYWKNLRGVGPAVLPPAPTPPLDQDTPFRVPAGFTITTYAKNIGPARVVIQDSAGSLLVSVPSQGKVLLLRDEQNDGKAEKIETLIEGLDAPHGLGIRIENGAYMLYVAETKALLKYVYNPTTRTVSNREKVVDLPPGGRHTTRTILVPDGSPNVYISVGSACDVCHEPDQRHGTVMVWDGKELKEYAKGLRNAVFITYHPTSGKIWGTEMGRDLLGDELPPDEINIIEEGKNYGWPICYGKNIHDTKFDKNTYIRNPCMEPFETQSHIDIPAHSAPLGLAFVPAVNWPAEYSDDLLVSYHGSWNRSTPTGYKVVRYRLGSDGTYEGVEDFITGFLQPGRSQAVGRPVGLLFASNGDLFVTDDKANAVYLVRHTGI